jgi:hypothetical protein
MSFIKYTIVTAIIMVCVFPTTAIAKKKVSPNIYMFGLAASFNDTIVHFTEIQKVDSALIDKKSHFLLGRESYSLQLRGYLTNQQMPYRTTIIFYDDKLNKLQKKYLKVKKLYTGDKKRKTHNDVRLIPISDFKFTSINISDDSETE